MYEDIINSRVKYEMQLRNAHADLERDKLNNEKINQYRKFLKELQLIYDKVSEYLDIVKIVETAVIKEARDYQTRRIEYLNGIITDAINRIFPDRNVQAKLTSTHSRSDKVTLELYDEFGNIFSPYICEGKLMQYLISVAAVAAITKSMGYSSLFIDEAFGVARWDHFDDLGKLLQSFIDSGMQLVVVSQNSALYDKLPRHEIYLKTVEDGFERFAVVEKMEDIDIFEEELEEQE